MKIFSWRRPSFALSRLILRRSDGAAALEFAILAPVFAVTLIAIVDFAFAFYSKLQLASAVAAGAQYAYVNGQSLTSSTASAFITNVQTVVGGASALTISSPTVYYNNVASGANANNCYCISNTGTWTTGTCGAACSVNGPTAGKYVSISANYTYTPIFPTDRYISSGTITEAALIRVQ